MKFFATTLCFALPLLVQVQALTVPQLSARQTQQLKAGGRKNNGGRNKAGNSKTAAAAGNNNNNSTSAAGAASASNSTSTASAGSAAASNSTSTASAGSGNNSNDPQTSLTLDPRVVATGFANNGQNVAEAGQVPSLTSTNNFINFCLTVPNLPITNGKQITTGSCNPAPIGTIPSTSNMPSAKFQFPKNGDTVPANQAFTISMAIQNLETGNFVNAQENYFAAPQQLNSAGQIVGHSHVVVEQLDSLAQTTPTDPRKFAFFKGLNAAAVGGVLTADVTNGLPAAAYRLCSINTAANHQPAIVPVAQHGALDDCIYFTASANGAAAAGGAAAGAAAGGAAAGSSAAGAAASSTAAASSATDTAAAASASNTAAAQGNTGGRGRKNNNGGQSKNKNGKRRAALEDEE